jgi:ribonuclease HII
MPWQVGIDEAGYGPNLGPFVMTMVTASTPADCPDPDLWSLLRSKVRRHGDPDDGRVLVADSKLVHSSAHGVGALERHTAPFLLQQAKRAKLDATRLTPLRQAFCLTPDADWLAECWLETSSILPASDVCPTILNQDSQELEEVMATAQAGVWGFRWLVVFPRQFNALIAEHGSKAAATQHALERLVQTLPREALDPDASQLLVDKHGGRNFYYEMLQSAFSSAPVLIRQEHARGSHYAADLGENRWEIRFEPEADARHFTVALASMLSKYLRELLMLQFNRFWQQHVPGLKPTAGYPGDAKRFWRDIDKARKRLGIAPECLWRNK